MHVLTCFSQYEITDISNEHLTTLFYGLFRTTDTHHQTIDGRNDGLLTRQLLSQLAFQLRILRRRTVIPTLANLATFLVAFVFSVVLSLAELGESSSVDPLILGLLFSWLPVLVIFATVDRNPVSADRARFVASTSVTRLLPFVTSKDTDIRISDLMQRWLYNIQAVKLWRDNITRDVEWWPGPASPDEDGNEQPPPTPRPEYGNEQPPPEPPFITTLKFGQFIGQGRTIQYPGFSHAVMKEMSKQRDPEIDTERYTDFAQRVDNKLQGRRPASWFFTTGLSQVLVMTEVMLAFMLAFNTPTVGLGCWSGSIAIYAILSSLSWILSLIWQKPGSVVTWLCHTFNALAFLWLTTVTMLLVRDSSFSSYSTSLSSN